MTAYTEALLNDEAKVEGRSLKDALYEAGEKNGTWPNNDNPLVGNMNYTIVCYAFCD